MDTLAPESAALPADMTVETTHPDTAPEAVRPDTVASNDAALDIAARALVPADEPTDDAATAAASTLNAKKRSLEGRKQTYQQQINELARQRGEMQRAMEAEQRQYAEWRQQQQRPAEPEARQMPADDPNAPTEDQFETYGQYVQATSAYYAQSAVQQATHAAQQQAQEQGRQRYHAQIDGAHVQRMQDYTTANPGFPAIVNREDIQLSVPMIDVIKQSQMGPQMMEYLARHTDEAEQLAREGNPLVAYGAMKVLEERVAVASRGASTPAPSRSHARPPITPVGSAPSSGVDDASDLPFGSEYVTRMNAQERARRRLR
jgi:preprotein translocase subunit SecD